MANDEQLDAEAGSGTEHTRPSGGPLSAHFPPHLSVWQEARRLVADKKSRVENLAVCIAQDPVLVMELLRVSNAMYFSGGRSPITSAQTAIVRLGSDTVLEHLDRIGQIPQFDNDDIKHWFEIHRSRGKRTGIIARILAEALARTLSDDCQAAALFTSVGDMLAVAHFGTDYVELTDEHSRSGINYKLAQEHKFDVEKMGLSYLRRVGIPEALLFAIDREARTRAQDRAIMKPLCMAAVEMVDAFDGNRWEKLAPGKSLAPKSSIRMLGLADAQYLKIYERGSEYLFAARLADERERADKPVPQAIEVTPAGSIEVTESLRSEIDRLINDPVEEEEDEWDEPVAPPKPQKVTQVKTINEVIDANDSFSLKAPRENTKTVPRVKPSAAKPAVAPPRLRTNGGNQFVGAFSSIMDKAKTSEDLLSNLLSMLVDDGPFEKTALIVVSRDRKHAIVVAARGPSIGNGQKVALNDPLSPLAQCFSKVQSFGNKSNEASPFGSKAFALAPIDADHETPVALYADCGNEGSLSFEARRIFRTVVDLINQKLPEIPGGIPVELG